MKKDKLDYKKIILFVIYSIFLTILSKVDGSFNPFLDLNKYYEYYYYIFLSIPVIITGFLFLIKNNWNKIKEIKLTNKNGEIIEEQENDN